MTASTEATQHRVSNPAIPGTAAGPYSQGVKAEGLLFMSGVSAFAIP